MRKAKLILDDGSEFCGWSFGYEQGATGEVVFNTAMTGYPESLTDPSYAGQILVMTYPLVGNYGVPPIRGERSEVRGERVDLSADLPDYWESERIHPKALIVADYSREFSHWNAQESLAAWLKREKVPALTGIDTRRLTILLREHGVMRGRISLTPDPSPKERGVVTYANGFVNNRAISSPLLGRGAGGEADYGSVNWVEKVSCKERTTYRPATDHSPHTTHHSSLKKVVLVDCGLKANIIRCLLRRGVEVVRVPWDYDFNQLDFDGLFLSNGPGDPERCSKTVEHIRTFMETESQKLSKGETVNSYHVRPLMGICLGNQLLAKAAGARTYKLKYGHRSHNQPVRLVGTERCFITSQNHGYAVDDTTLPDDWEPLFVNMNDASNEGIRHKTQPWFSVQFHPEACGGPTDTEWLFDEFVSLLGNEEFFDERSGEAELHSSLKKVLLLGSGALKIGQAGEFDYSGAQALKVLKEEGITSILVNPNIATVQTSKDMADKVYFQPVTPEIVERIIAKERPDGILLSFGGQTALNCGVELYRRGVLDRYGVSVLGTPVQAIIDTEDRHRFVKRLDEIGVKTIKSVACQTMEEVQRAVQELGFPVILRAAYALGGLGSGFCEDEEELLRQAEEAFSFSGQVLVEKSLKGWKEVEYEVVRDAHDNCITVCNMENLDPLGIHTGESIVVAPSQTLSNAEYHKLRALAIKVVRHLGIVGECNVQYALDPQSEDYRVIEVNARLSRSSALASKATGYPLAYVAAKLALGYGLYQLTNSVTKTTPAFFEPALDYVVVKIPRWDLSKFHGVNHCLGSSMKSVGEVMAIGRTFEEAMQKGLRMIGQGMHGFVENRQVNGQLKEPTDMRIFVIAQALQHGYSVEQIHQLTKIDRWFLQKLSHIVEIDQRLHEYSNIPELLTFMDNTELLEYLETPEIVTLLRDAKTYGFSDFQIAHALGLGNPAASEVAEPSGKSHHAMNMEQAGLTVRSWRKELGIVPTVNQIDTLAAEYPAQTNYLYLSYTSPPLS